MGLPFCFRSLTVSGGMQAPVHILVVEDDEMDAEAIERALEGQRWVAGLVTARNGVEALAALRGSDGSEPLARPYLILLDLNMPRMSGLEFLSHLRADPELADSLVFVLTTSNADRDRKGAYTHNIAGYLVKSRVGEDFGRLAELLGRYAQLILFP